MKCQSCQAEIPPSWVHAISNNICPGCGQPIMNEDTQKLIQELKIAMEKMPNDPAGLAGWLVCNYSMTKIGSSDPVVFHRKNTESEESVSITPQNNKKLHNPSVFLNRALGSKVSNISKAIDELKKVKQSNYQEKSLTVGSEFFNEPNDDTSEELDQEQIEADKILKLNMSYKNRHKK
jgi:hypothetical protein